jgi:uncharacterized protein YbcV (DUF1398 family)
MDTEIMKEALEASESGKSTFPQVVGKLRGCGILLRGFNTR